jgi:hypothetical protein
MVIVSMSILPSRLGSIQRVINGVLNQSLKPDKIILYLPKTFKRKNKENDWTGLDKISGVSTRLVEDVGPATKLWYALEEFWEEDVRIITLDDDMLVPTNWLENLINYSDEYPNHSLGYTGRILNGLKYNQSRKIHCTKISKELEVDLLLGVTGVLYKPKFFKKDVFKSFSPNEHMFYTDDIWYMGNLAKNNIKRMLIPNKNNIEPLDSTEMDSLWSINRASKNNDLSLEYFKKDWNAK